MKSNRYGMNQTGNSTVLAFTLVEMLLVLVIIGLLAAIVYPNLAPRGRDSRIKATKVQIAAFTEALDTFQIENGHYPHALNDLVQRPGDAANWHGPYVHKIPKDPWEHDYIYVCPGKHNSTEFDLMSLGEDGQTGTQDDITNWE